VPLLRQTFFTVANLPCDVLVTPHPVASRLWYRLGDAATEPLVDAGACRRYADAAAKRLDARLASEQGAKP
jgi:metallo-beta-lactamase class B